jgi:hypothetical protein
MTTRGFAHFSALVDLIKAYGANTDSSPFHVRKLIEVDKFAATERPLLRMSVVLGWYHEIDDVVHILAYRNPAPIEDVDLPCISDER